MDDEATIDVVPFCNALVQVTVARNNKKLRQFVEDDMLPALIRRLYDGLPCTLQRTISKLSVSKLSNQMIHSNEKAKQDLLVLCQKIYTLCVRSQVCFSCWFSHAHLFLAGLLTPTSFIDFALF